MTRKTEHIVAANIERQYLRGDEAKCRHMKTIGYLGQIDKLYGVPATTRNWNTIVAILRILKGQKNTR